MLVRINKYLADSAVGSRRKSDDLINSGLVRINGKIAMTGQKINPETDDVEVSGKIVTPIKDLIYLVLNKPVGYITTSYDEHGRKIVLDLLPNNLKDKRVYPVGRLDYDSRGLLLLTNDGKLTYKITHPKHHIKKEYLVKVRGKLSGETIKSLNNAVDINGEKINTASVSIVSDDYLRFVLYEGKNRQIRKMCDSVGLEVLDLQRIRIGNIKLDNLPEGKYRFLSQTEIDSLN